MKLMTPEEKIKLMEELLDYLEDHYSSYTDEGPGFEDDPTGEYNNGFIQGYEQAIHDLLTIVVWDKAKLKGVDVWDSKSFDEGEEILKEWYRRKEERKRWEHTHLKRKTTKL